MVTLKTNVDFSGSRFGNGVVSPGTIKCVSTVVSKQHTMLTGRQFWNTTAGPKRMQ